MRPTLLAAPSTSCATVEDCTHRAHVHAQCVTFIILLGKRTYMLAQHVASIIVNLCYIETFNYCVQ